MCVLQQLRLPGSLDSSGCHHELLSASAAEGSSSGSLASGTSTFEVPAYFSGTSLRICSSVEEVELSSSWPGQAPQQAASGSSDWEPIVPGFQAPRASVQDLA